ncbi:MAG: S-layer homology domain-containing protein [Lawsonibacter sp.]|nr:S-layer homology domain-containing protein [Lawsonibacter sp.]
MKKRVLSALLAAVMACTLLCIPAGAAAQEYQAGYMFVTFPNDVKKQETVYVYPVDNEKGKECEMFTLDSSATELSASAHGAEPSSAYFWKLYPAQKMSDGTFKCTEEGAYSAGWPSTIKLETAIKTGGYWYASLRQSTGPDPALDREGGAYMMLNLETSSAQGPSDWAKEIVKQAEDAGLVCFSAAGIYQEKITRLQFAQLAVTLMEQQAGDLEAGAAGAFTDTSDPLVLKAVKLGVVSGKGDGKFAPNDPVTRQEICVMLSKTMEYLDDNRDTIVIDDHSTEIDTSRFNDVDTVAPWAHDAVAMLTNNGILNGLDGGIAPHANTTVEQAIIMIWAVFNKG